MSRRRMIGALAAGALLPRLAAAAGAVRRLTLVREETGEAARGVVFWEDGRPSAPGLDRLDRLLRDVRAGEVSAIDVRLYYLLWALQSELGGRTIVVTSGYRTAATNQALLRQGIDVARNSFHLAGRAVDFKIDGVPTTRLAGLGRYLGLGGVGRYPTFIHLDTGPVRRWTG